MNILLHQLISPLGHNQRTGNTPLRDNRTADHADCRVKEASKSGWVFFFPLCCLTVLEQNSSLPCLSAI